MLRYALTIFISALLLFQVQPLVSKTILPWFGGTPAVWTTCMLFFQVLLLAGYAYAHVVSSRLARTRQVLLHLMIMAAALAVLPIIPNPGWKPDGTEAPTWRILALLAATVGLPYFVLSTTGPLVQAWFSLARPGASPYRLYALSNVGSLLALVSYPFLVEPLVPLRMQAVAWSVGFGVFVLLCAAVAVHLWTRARADHTPDRPTPATAPHDASPDDGPPGWDVRVLWIALPACASVLLLAITNHMCLDVASVPFLWILPLCLYLLSFIICFDNQRWYYRPLFAAVFAASLAAVCVLLALGADPGLKVQVAGYSIGLFVCCMVCHGELVRLKPSPRYLTSFYLCIATGGALGGVGVALVAPAVFCSYFELHIAIWCCGALFVVALFRDVFGPGSPRSAWRRWLTVGLSAVTLGVLAGALGAIAAYTVGRDLSVSRNFYGVLHVRQSDPADPQKNMYMLRNGHIDHGGQFVLPARRRLPTTYYGPKSGVGVLLRHYAGLRSVPELPWAPIGLPWSVRDVLRAAVGDQTGGGPTPAPIRVGAVGLGVGTVAVYGRPGDHFRFYEINPGVHRLATTRFTYLHDCLADWDVVMGDGRLSLEREPPHRFDVLVLDAFSSDSIPVHLLTREAFDVYVRCLKPDGVLAVHISNRYLDLLPVVRALAHHFHLDTAVIESDDDDAAGVYSATWVLVTANRSLLRTAAIRDATAEDDGTPPDPRYLWTDDFSNLFDVLK